ncbi:hypothetical protein [Rhodococcus rhodochrous]|uniref:hypothetical protein n=1 Tax=Rhodococcus rhodochrous TaxID=1829 RepID=UPI0021BD00CE|nr:hypothetical protein [Rhodococcus rhodochrous]
MAGSAFVWTADSFVQDVSAGAWVHDALSRFADGHRGTVVGDVVPPVFEAYARVLHPAHRRIGPAAGEVEPVTWGEVAKANERIAHPLMEWDFITATPHRGRGQPGLWDEGPATGDLDGATARALIAVLASFTTTADRCWFAIWEGHSILDDVRDRAGRMQAGWMGMFLIADAITAGGGRFRTLLSPNLWWPQDRAWCVATNIDLMASYVGGSRQCVEAILASSDLEAFEVEAEMSVQRDSDSVNPRPERS